MLHTLMKDYLHESETKSKGAVPRDLFGRITESVDDVPVQVEKSEWAVADQPERLARKYKFDGTSTRNWFLRELLEDEGNNGHHGKITITGDEVMIEVWTHDVDAITELDIEYAGRCDDIYGDVALLGELGYGY